MTVPSIALCFTREGRGEGLAGTDVEILLGFELDKPRVAPARTAGDPLATFQSLCEALIAVERRLARSPGCSPTKEDKPGVTIVTVVRSPVRPD